MRWGRKGAATLASGVTFAVVAGCGLATSGLLDAPGDVDAGSTPSSLPDADVKGSDGSQGAPALDAGDPDGTTDGAPGADAPADVALDAACPAPSADASVGYATQPTVPIKIDGDLGDWKCTPRTTLTSANAQYVKAAGETISGDIAVLWDKDNLYVSAHIVDANVSGNDPVDPYKNDAFELFVTGDATPGGDFDAVSHQLITDWHGLTVDYGGSRAPVKNPPHVSAKTKTVADGWTIEVAVGWQAVQAAQLVSGGTLGFDYSMNDGDGSGAQTILLGIVTRHGANANCTCAACCCGQQDDIDLPNCDTATFGRITLQ